MIAREDSSLMQPGSALTKEETNQRTMNRQDDEPIIDFQLEQELSGLDDLTVGVGKKQQLENNTAAKPAAPQVVMKNKMNESSDFDLDNY